MNCEITEDEVTDVRVNVQDADGNDDESLELLSLKTTELESE